MSGGYVPIKQLAAIVAAHRAEHHGDARVAFVLAPGGAAGAYQAGALEALAEHGVRPDLLIGTSSGALNALGVVLDALAPPAAPRAWPVTRPGRIWRALSQPDAGARLLVDKPHLLGFIAGKAGASMGLAGEMLGHLPHLGAEWAAMQAGLFRADRLRGLLVGSIARALGHRGDDAEAAGHALVDTWAAAHAAGLRPPELIVLATDMQSHQATPFALGTPDLTERLFRHHHPVRALGHGALTGPAVVDAFVASAAIPGAFPAVALPADNPSWPARRYLDGAIGASEPFHLAIDAGATLIISLEVAPYARPPRPDGTTDRHPLALAADALMAIQERYLRADARGLAAWNWRLTADCAPGRQRIVLYRLAPSCQAIGLLDFDGRHEGGALTLSLFDWYMEGYGDAGGCAPEAWAGYVRERDDHGDTGVALERGHGAGFWEASLREAPGRRPAVPSSSPPNPSLLSSSPTNPPGGDVPGLPTEGLMPRSPGMGGRGAGR